MKQFLFLLLTASVAMSARAQSSQYQDAMTKQVALLDDGASYNPQTLQDISNVFERIAATEKTEWLPYYYAAFAQVMTAFVQEDKSKIDPLADRAEANINKADSLKKNSDEIACIKSLVASARIMVDPPSRGAQYGPESGMMIQKAKQLNPENPRVYLLEGQALYFTPEAYGGDKAKARETLQVALQKFAAFKPASNIEPHWGEAQAKQLLNGEAK
ncbi:hypothetical protein F0L74_06635 [Chitinophaga agrisoli]|uniref:Tetratricopeptide repeat protein n=1 Tax=Chitinophaga agrisoli TaxID=2607653 RepID=A0A5B2W4Y6_9BACT|nr:hypothetical protein [Chitinophaga agrisoli]KAA2245626.1 hypothetical protein F0L74_06635 [Chitinophaga agrisoli]